MTESPKTAEFERPSSLFDLFWTLTILALQGFGGVMAVAQRELVDRKRWMSNEEFVEEWAVAQIVPGPNIINLCIMLGNRYFGWRGSLVAILGMLLLPTVILLLLALLHAHYAALDGVAQALRGMGAVAAGLIAAVGLKLLPTLRKNVLGLAWSVLLGGLGFAAVAILRWPLALVLLSLGGLSWWLAYRRLAP
jgi:chromate transporter